VGEYNTPEDVFANRAPLNTSKQLRIDGNDRAEIAMNKSTVVAEEGYISQVNIYGLSDDFNRNALFKETTLEHFKRKILSPGKDATLSTPK